MSQLSSIRLFITCILLSLISLELSAQECDNTGPSCVTTCVGQEPDSAHQWCGGCQLVVYCQSEESLTLVACPPGNVWDDCLKRCIVGTSSQSCRECYNPEDGVIALCVLPTTTTPAPTIPPAQCIRTGPTCVYDCLGRVDGDYQWCGRCDHYIACVAQATTERPCPLNSPWDDCSKRCEVLSNTCRVCDNDGQLVVDCNEPTTVSQGPTISTTQEPQCESTGPTCYATCGALANGNYQYCGNCRQYLTCANGQTFIFTCPAGLIWDDVDKNCDRASTTCEECYFAPSPTVPVVEFTPTI